VKSLIWLLIIIFYLLFVSPALAAVNRVERIPLTVEILETRINNLVQSEGLNNIDLSHLIIDITEQSSQFTDFFYRQIRDRLNRSKEPLGIDLSDSLIRGNLNITNLGLTTQLSPVAFSSILTPLEQEQLQKEQPFFDDSQELIPNIVIFRGALKLDRTIVSGQLDFSNTFFLQRVEAIDANFINDVDFSGSRWLRNINFNNSKFNRNLNINNGKFFGKLNFNKTQFLGALDLSDSIFYENTDFSESQFKQLADFENTQWLNSGNFNKVIWSDRALFSESKFIKSISLKGSTLEKNVAFRECYFNDLINFEEVKVLDQVDFSNSIFTNNSYLNVPDLAFDSDKAKILGDTDIIGKVISVPLLEGNEYVLRNLVRNFRNLEQIPDANQIEYQREKLKLQQLNRQLFNNSWQEILRLGWLVNVLPWMGLSLLLLLSDYGTNFTLVFGVGLVAISYFGLIFWWLDRYRRKLPTPIVPNRYETICMITSCGLLSLLAVIDILHAAKEPLLTFTCLAIVLLPLPLFLLVKLYREGRYHDLMNSSYFVEDGSLRQLRIMVGRLPNMPRFPFYRDRYLPLLWERRWNWLNYYDFSLNNLLKFGFNDLRVRDEHLPGIISILVWYQWALGILYIIILFWTLSRTIPGLNLLIYF
jgi:hypothetical protein